MNYNSDAPVNSLVEEQDDIEKITHSTVTFRTQKMEENLKDRVKFKSQKNDLNLKDRELDKYSN